MFANFFLVLIVVFSPCEASTEATIHSPAQKNVIRAVTDLQTYIVFLKKPEGKQFAEQRDLDRWYQSFLPESDLKFNEERMVYAYRSLVTGFAARLTADEVKEMEGKEGFVSAHLEKVFRLQTTHTPSFLGLKQNSGLWNLSDYGSGMIIGIMDSGVAIEHPSFSSEGMPPPPAKWKGICEFKDIACNNKIIGARYYRTAGGSPHDDYGHGTHTASTAAGRPVEGVDYDGQLNGTAVGIAPMAHLAIYRVCNGYGGCAESDVLAGMENAVDDGVDVLSLSLTFGSLNYTVDSIAIGAFAAIQRGIFVSCAAANAGPLPSSLSNEAPWILTVGASTVDRSIRATVKLTDNAEFNGQSFYQPKDFPLTPLPLVYAGTNSSALSAFCTPDAPLPANVKGKIVLCEMEPGSDTDGLVKKGEVVKEAGGAAMILMSDMHSGNYTVASFHVLPASHVTYEDGLRIKAYINSTSSPSATILFKGTVYGVPYAPQVALFSSRGPSRASPEILKPDILGPGVDILAAWPSYRVNTASTSSPSTFKLKSGTSMACPHLAGVAALLKRSHPDWSPAAIKSAIITTADPNNLRGTPITDQLFAPANIFATGSGQVNPPKANDPGLVYDIQPNDYIHYLCGLGRYSERDISIIVNQKVSCSSNSSIPEGELNYPTFAIRLGSSPQTYTRTVTNVGHANSSYNLEIVEPFGVNVKVEPEQISFTELNQKATYSVTFSRITNTSVSMAQGYLMWASDQHNVRSAIAVVFQ